MKFTSFVIILFVFWSVNANATGNTGSLNGTVKSSEGEPLEGAAVVLIGTKIGAATDSRGNFLITNIKHGVYTIRISMIGYKPIVYENIDITPGSLLSMNIEMQTSQLDLEEVVVEAISPIIRRDITGTVHEVGRDKIENLPIDLIEQIAGLQTGVTRDGYIRGGRQNELLYLIDGLPVNDLISGGLGTDLPKSSVEQYTLQTGGMEAEYGDALSGIINITTITQKEKTTRSIRLKADHLQGSTENNRETEAELFFSGPLAKTNMSYLFSGNVNMSDTRWWQDMQFYFKSPFATVVNFLSKLEFDFGAGKTLALQGLYSNRRWREYEFSWRFNLDGLPRRKRESIRVALFWSHSLSERTLYSVALARYDIHSRIGTGSPDDLTLEPWQYDFLLRYVISGKRNWWEKTDQVTYTLKSDIQSKLFNRHMLKAGFNLNFFDITSDLRKLEPRKTYYGKPIIDADLLNYSNKYHYEPRSGSFFIQDKIVSGYDGSTLSAGLRFDFLNPRARRPALELIPIGENEYTENIIKFVPASIKYNISPRLGFSAPLTDKLIMYLNYGQYFQNPLFKQLYSGLSNVQFRFGNSVLRGNPDLEPQTTTVIEWSFKYSINYNTSLSAVYYRKETENQIDTKTFLASNSRIAGDYGFAEFVNNPLAQSSGIEFNLSRKAGKWINGNISYVLSRAKGLSQSEDQGLNYAQWGFELPPQMYFMSWDQRHTFKGDMLFRTKNDFVVSLIWEFHSGRPYTFYPSINGITPLFPDQQFVPNNKRLPSSRIMDVQISKKYVLSKRRDNSQVRSIMVYLSFRNLADAKNALWKDSSGRIGGELADPSAYDIGRRIFMGIILTL